MTTIRLPIPPSLNKMYGNNKSGKGRGRYKTAAYRAWVTQADLWYLTQKRDVRPITGPAEIEIRLPMKMRGDVSNRIKAAEDWLVSRQITSDDRHNRQVTVGFGYVDCCEITVRPA